jgi:ATP-binding cassette subfamily C protein
MNKIFQILSLNIKLKFLIIGLLIILTSIFEILFLLSVQSILQVFLNIKIDSHNFSFFSFNFNFNNSTLFLFFTLTFFFRNIFYALTSITKNKLIANLHIDISHRVYFSYLKKDYAFFLKNNSSKLISNIISEINFFCYNVLDVFLIFLTEIIIVLAIIFFLFLKFFEFSSILFLFSFILFFLSILTYKNKLKKIGLERSLSEKKKIDNLQKSFYAIQSVKLDSIESFFLEKYDSYNTTSVKKLAFLNTFNDLHKPLWETLLLMSFILSMYIGYNFFDLFRADLVLILGTFAFALFRFLPSLNRILNSYNSFMFYAPSIDIVHNELTNSNFIFKEKKHVFDFKFSNQIKLNNVSFQYSDKSRIILDKINITIKHNSITFIKGESGTGKSTLLNIICGLLSPTTGEVLVDDKNINSFLRSYQSKIGYVPQKTLLLDDTILDNIIFGQQISNVDLSLVKEVISKSKLNNLIDKLPNGLDTIIGERGSFLSGGEQQRLGIARALYKKPQILILDEATSALDEDTERLILEEIFELQEFITVIIISHKKLHIQKKFELFELANCKVIQDKNYLSNTL